MSEKVTFQELIESIAGQTDNSRQFTHDFLKDLVAVINNGLESDGTVNIAGFGKFKLRPMDEREGYNPQTGEKITIPAHNKIVFKPYKSLRELVNVPYAHLEAELLDDKPETGSSERREVEDRKSSSSSESQESGQKPSGEMTENDRKKASGEQSAGDTGDEIFDPGKYPLNTGHEEEQTGFQSDEQTDAFDDGDIVEYSPHINRENVRTEMTGSPSPAETRGFEPDELGQKFSPAPPSQEPEQKRNRSSNRIWIIAAACIVLLLTAGASWYVISLPENDARDNQAVNLNSVSPSGDEQKQDPASSSRQPDPAASSNSSGMQGSGSSTRAAQSRQAYQSTSTRQVIAEGQTLWSLADQQYDNPYLWPWIYDENKSSINNPDLILAGKTLALPLPGGAGGDLSTNDSLQVAVGYVETYRWYKNHGYEKAKYYLYAARIYKGNVFDHTDVNIDDADLAFANRAR